MKIVDLNLLLYAVNKRSAQHKTAHRWWEQAINRREPVGLAWIVLVGFLRLSTNPRVFPRPLQPPEALEKVDAWLRHPNTKIVMESDEHWGVLRQILEQTGTAGNLATDAHLAALAISWGATLVSFDTDFARFPRLHWENPGSPKGKSGGN